MKTLALPAALLLPAALTSCSRTSDQPPAPGSPASRPKAPPIKIGFIVKQPEVSWFQREWRFANQAARELAFSVVKIGAPDGAVRALEGRGFPAASCIAIGINGTDCIDELEKQKPTSFLGSLLPARQHGCETATMMFTGSKTAPSRRPTRAPPAS